MTKPVARLGVSIDPESWKTLSDISKVDELRTFDFAIEAGYPCVWLYYVGTDEQAITRLVDMREDLPCKSGGELRDWAQASSEYFGSAVRLARAEKILSTTGEASDRHAEAERERTAALQEFDEARRRFEAALLSDAHAVAEHEEFERENSERLRFLFPERNS